MTPNEIRSYLGTTNSNPLCGRPPGTLLIFEATIHGRVMPPDGAVVRDGVTFKAMYKPDGWDRCLYTGDGKWYPVNPLPYPERYIPDTLDVSIVGEATETAKSPSAPFVWSDLIT